MLHITVQSIPQIVNATAEIQLENQTAQTGLD